MPGTTRAIIAKKPEKNKYKDVISLRSLPGIKYIKLQIMNAMVSPKKNALEIFGFNGSMKTEQNSKDDKKDLKAKGYAFIRYKMIEDKE
jgi:hypothetical protein